MGGGRWGGRRGGRPFRTAVSSCLPFLLTGWAENKKNGRQKRAEMAETAETVMHFGQILVSSFFFLCYLFLLLAVPPLLKSSPGTGELPKTGHPTEAKKGKKEKIK